MRRTLNVTHVVLSLDVGGLERNVVNQVRLGGRLGQRVSVICLERRGALAGQAEQLGGQVYCLDKPPGLRLELIGRLTTAFRRLRPDVVHTHQVGSLFYSGPAARLARVPVLVHTEHGVEDYASPRKRWLGRLAGRYAHRFYCLTEAMRAAVVACRVAPTLRARVIHNGIDTPSFRAPTDPLETRRVLGIPERAPVVGTVGRLTEVKRQDLLLRAFGRVRAQVADAHLLLLGDGPLMGSLRDLVAQLGLGDCVHFAGYQPHSAPYLRAMDVFALTSRSEGMPQALLEAAVVGVPTVAAAVGGIPEVVEHGRTGLLFAPGDEAALAADLYRLLADRPEALRLSTAAREKVEARYSIERMADDYHRDFLELLARRSVRRAGRPARPGVLTPGAGEPAAAPRWPVAHALTTLARGRDW
jgi:glycosyltransferase involved in cell wall biosynthesis